MALLTLSYAVLLPEAIAVTTLGSLFAVIIIQIIARSLGIAVVWTEEVIQLLFVWLCFVSAALGVKWHSHFRVPALISRIPLHLRLPMAFAGEVVVAVAALVLLVQGWNTTLGNVGQKLPLTGLSVAWVNLSLPVSASLMLIYACGNMARMIASGRAATNEW